MLGEKDAGSKKIYRVRKSASDAKTQFGAYTNLDSAKAKADENEGYNVYDRNALVYTGKKQVNLTNTKLVKITVRDLRIRSGPGLSYVSRGYIAPGKYTIVDEKEADGYNWGKLKSGAGWIALKYAEAV